MAAVRKLAWIGSTLLLAVAVAGCGSSNKSSTSTSAGTTTQAQGGSASDKAFSLAQTKACFNRSGATAAAIKNPAISGTGGDLKVKFTYGTSDIYIAFGKDDAEAQALENRAIALAVNHEKLDRATVLQGVRLYHNVFYYSPDGPVSTILTKRVTACLH
jgi:hypothetical protein